MIRRASIAVLALALLLGPAVPAAAAGSFTFFGSGWGHGLGLSQWGAYGLAQHGWGYGRILTHFYSGTKVSTDANPPRIVRVGLAQGRKVFHLSASNGDVDLRLGDRKRSSTIATIPAGQTWRVKMRSADGAYRVIDASGTRVGPPVGGPATNLYAVFGQNDAVVRVPEAGHRYAHGWMEFNIYGCTSTCAMRLILTLPPQAYLYGLGEVPSSWPKPALRTQAIAARTYAFRRIQTAGQHRSGCNCALYATSIDQVYVGYEKEAGLLGGRWVDAVDGSKDQVVTYHGAMIEAYYTSSSGGFTENNENVWGGSPIPYLRGVCDPGDYTSANPNAVWKTSFTAQQVTRRLRLGIGTVTGFGHTVRGVSGRIVSVVVKGTAGRTTIGGGTLRSALGLQDDRVWINRNRQVVGSIRHKYDAIDCRSGLPTSRRVRVAGGARQAFQRGTIFAKDGAAPHEVTGAALAYYLKHRGPKGPLGFPVTDTHRLKNGNSRTKFEHGKVTCTPSGSCWRS